MVNGQTIPLNFSLHLIDEIDDPKGGAVGIIVTLEDGAEWIGTVFTIRAIDECMKRHEISGESAGGRYFWTTDLVIVRELTTETLELVIGDLLRTGSLHAAFSRYEPSNVDLDEASAEGEEELLQQEMDAFLAELMKEEPPPGPGLPSERLGFSITLSDSIDDPESRAADVILALNDGTEWIGTFFTFQAIDECMRRHEITGGSAGGRYFWTADLVIVRELTMETLELTFGEMVEESGVHFALSKYDSSAIDLNERRRLRGRCGMSGQA